MKTQAREDLEKYLSQFLPDQIAECACPACNAKFGTLIPDKEDFSSAAACPDCGVTFFKVVSKDGTVVNTIPESAS